MKKTQIGYLLVAIIVVLIVIGYNYKKPAQVTPDNNAPQTENNTVTQDENIQVREIAMDSFTEIINGKYFPQYSIKEITVKKGETIRLKINTTGNHDFKIDELNVYSETPAGEITTVEFTADKVGEFIYYCTKPNHRTNGHWGTIKVVDSDSAMISDEKKVTETVADTVTEKDITSDTPTEPVATEKSFSLAEVAKHNTKTDCWTVVNGKVYDITAFIALGVHKPIIEKGCGIDSTSMFEPKHGDGQKETLAGYIIGSLI